MTQEKFVERFESAIIEFAILNRASTMNEVTPEQVHSNLPKGYSIDRNVVAKRFERLVNDGHLQKNGDKYKISDDGREDVQKLQPLALELPQLVQKGGMQTTQGNPQRSNAPHAQATTGGSSTMTSNKMGSGSTQGQGNANAGNAGERSNAGNWNKDR